jgi:hypothetical protein
MSKQTQFIVLDVNHPQHPMHPVDPDNHIVLRQRYGDGKPTKSKPEDFASVDLVATTSVFNAEHTMVSFKDLIICTDKSGGSYAFLGEWRNGMCHNPKVVCRDLRRDAPPARVAKPTALLFVLQAGANEVVKSSTMLTTDKFDVVTLVESCFSDGTLDLIMCYQKDGKGRKHDVCFYLGHWNDGC